MGNANMADMRTSEFGAILVPLDIES